MTDILYSDVIDTSGITNTLKKSQIDSMLSQMEQTPEGQFLFGRIQESSGNIDFTNDETKGTVYGYKEKDTYNESTPLMRVLHTE